MSDASRCGCQRCTVNSLMGPILVTTIGILFLLGELRGGYLSFGNTWPVILVVIGLVKLAAAFAPRAGHLNGTAVPPDQPGMPPGPPSNPASGQGQ